MLHRVYMDIVNMQAKIIFIAYGVFPEPLLPDRAVAVYGNKMLYEPPPRGKIGIFFRQPPYAMDMVGHDDISGYGKRIPLPDMGKGLF